MTDLVQLSFALGSLDPEAMEEACFALGADSVSFEDAADDPVLEPRPGELRLWPATRVAALFRTEERPQDLVARVAAHLAGAGSISAQRVQPRIWEREWLKDFHAMRFGRRLWICPHHEEVREPGAVVVRLDPGMAFGTGTHASTALCLEWLDAHLAPGARVIDYGCGSGVLAVAALALGAAECACFDIDPQALTATRENAAANGVAGRLSICERPEDLPGPADVLLANILAGTLIELAPELARRVAHGGQVVLAGLMEAQEAGVTHAFVPWFDMLVSGRRDGWTTLMGRRRDDAQPERGARST